jgi:demethylmenaquinone methyltransferase/2-methoxy-6-polyprenyl-1,4-benzoquinol methylase
VKAFFDRLADNWDENCLHDPKKIAAVVTLANIGMGTHVVDIGCGTGIMFEEILSRKPAELLGIDLSDKMIAIAKSKFHDDRLRLMTADLFDIKETGFNVATIYSAYPHFHDKLKLAQKVSSMLADGGRVMIAHSQSKEIINAHHQGPEIKQMSVKLLSVEQEALNLSEFFNIDILVDTPDMYMISGLKK